MTADIVPHPKQGKPVVPRGARAELLAMIGAARSAGYVRGVFIAEGVDGDVQVFPSSSVTPAHTRGLLLTGVELWEGYMRSDTEGE